MMTREQKILKAMQLTRMVILAVFVFLYVMYTLTKAIDENAQSKARNYIETIQNYTIIGKSSTPIFGTFTLHMQAEDGSMLHENVSWMDYLYFREGETVGVAKLPTGYIPLRGPGNAPNAKWADSSFAAQDDEKTVISIELPFNLSIGKG